MCLLHSYTYLDPKIKTFKSQWLQVISVNLLVWYVQGKPPFFLILSIQSDIISYSCSYSWHLILIWISYHQTLELAIKLLVCSIWAPAIWRINWNSEIKHGPVIQCCCYIFPSMILRLGIYFICQPLGNLRKDFSEDRPQGFGTNYLQRTFYSKIIQFQLGVVQHTRHSWQKIIFVKIWCKIRIYISCMPLNWTLDEWHGWGPLIGQLG